MSTAPLLQSVARYTRAIASASKLRTGWLLAAVVPFLLIAPPGAYAQTTTTEIKTDGRMGAEETIEGTSTVFTIDHDLGLSKDDNLYHSFEVFKIGAGDTGLFTGPPEGYANVISQVTGGEPSRVDGTLESRIPRANFYFFNPNGVFFGQNAKVNVPAAFHVSSALGDPDDDNDPYGSFANKMHLVLDEDGAPSLLEMESLERFGFFGGDIQLDGTQLLFGDLASADPASPSGIRGDVSFRAENIEIDRGGKLLGLNRSATLQASGQVLLQGQDGENGYGSGIDVADIDSDSTTSASIDISGDTVELTDGAYLIAQATGAVCDSTTPCAGQIDILAENSIKLSGNSPSSGDASYKDKRFPGLNIDASPGTGSAEILTYTESEKEGEPGKVNLKAKSLIFLDGAQVQAYSQNPDDTATPRLVEARVTLSGVIFPQPADDNPGTILPNPPPSGPDISSDLRPDNPVGDRGSASVEIATDAETVVADAAEQALPPVGLGPPGQSTPASENASGPGDSSDDATDGPDTINPYMNMASRLDAALAECRRQEADGQTGNFRANRWPGIPLSPEGPLVAFSPLGDNPPARTRKNAATAGQKAQMGFLDDFRAGGDALRGGRTQQAVAAFRRAEQAAKADGDPRARSNALRSMAEAQQAAGAFMESISPLGEAIRLAKKANDPAGEAAALGALGNAYVALGEFKSAEDLLSQAVDVSRGIQIASTSASPVSATPKQPRADISVPAGLTGALLNNLGNQRMVTGNTQGALAAYKESSRAAIATKAWLQAAQAAANAGQASLILGDESEATRSLTFAHRALAESQATPAESTAMLIHLAHTEAGLARISPKERRNALLVAHNDLIKAIDEAQARGDLRTASHGLGSLGALYDQEGGRQRESFHLTLRALRSAKEAQATDLVARWYAQLGRLNQQNGRVEAALDAYRRAVGLLEETRPEASAVYGSEEVAFKKAVEPVYMALIDLILAKSTWAPSHETRQKLFAEARNVVEQWKAAELRSYFRDGCAAELKNLALDQIDSDAAVVYPIPLPDRLEILVGLSDGISRFTLPVGREKLEGEASLFRVLLQKRLTSEYKRPAKQLYDWLVQPYRTLLWKEGIDTLVFVPSGALRTIPMAALSDGEHFLIDDYAIAVTPSLNMLAPESLAATENEVLLAGLSEAVQGFPGLPSVPKELAAIEGIYGGEVLLNRDFSFEKLSRVLGSDSPDVVHIASHAEFSGNPENSFVLTHNDQLSMEELASLITNTSLEGEPIELLVLSACETAVGNDRAALGLTGVAIRAGARSAMGSLWSVSDEATSDLIIGFYEALQDPDSSKAQALRTAQRTLIAGQRFQHPFYWAPFMIINNWL